MSYLSASDLLGEDGPSYSHTKKSPNGKYETAAMDSIGSVALAHSRQGLLWEKSIHRPNQPSVSNNGIVAVESWAPSESRELSSELLIFNRDGEKLVRERYNANALRSGITADGDFAWFTTANADNKDGNQLCVYDVQRQERLLKTELLMRGVEGVEMSGNVIDVNIDGLRCCYKDGEIVESDDFQWAKEERRLQKANTPGNVAGVAKKRLKRADQLSEQQIRSTIRTARNFEGRGSDRTWAKLWRRKGELHHYLGEEKQALKDYEKALSLDEGVGVKRKTKRLRNELGEG
ncbi:tetratricopeptide repeat protein [Salinibacter ruber]|uniref:tetratricopeptide repeat protein n=1 Tax=Salinibacter ruber TaxID=146919 RepID=UPI0013C33C3B|nr:tetratricopeptide repeat protein [Salinibacter ruber]